MEIPQQMTPEGAQALFASLDAVVVDDLIGDWAGRGIATGHPLDGLLDVSGWAGKRFLSPEEVHPLIHRSPIGQISVNPGLIPMRLASALKMDRWPLARPFFYLIGPLLRTRRPRARLRMVDWGGLASAAMIYDQKPIVDHFRRIDEHRIMGLMDLRGDTQPFFFLLERR